MQNFRTDFWNSCKQETNRFAKPFKKSLQRRSQVKQAVSKKCVSCLPKTPQTQQTMQKAN